MDFCIVSEENIITNMVVADSADALPGVEMRESYDGACIGAPYDPPRVYTAMECIYQEMTDMHLDDIEHGQQITDEQLARIELGQRQTDIELSILGGTQHV
ncbi:hypothetical protein [Intestinibacillus massiliensis]|uniref:hypothetical protein n=1 Tax=Intestinibacillus massiliensis TaxID=1871029 RepID=UPI000B35028C|nr:hypothetical protein [Intestinibacillus massiliensis]